ncbi:MAG: hypothetical protein AB4062_21335 [Crocosphaera sp.]
MNEYCSNIATIFGFFVYDQWSSATLPYDCTGKPVIALNLHDLPENIQDLLTWNRFDDLSFNDRKKIQPLEHFPCDTWGLGQGWVDSDGNERKGHPYK